MPDLNSSNEVAAALIAALDQLIEKVKARRPISTDKKPTELGFVYSQLIQSMLINPRDYERPWSPSGGSSMQDAIDNGTAPAKQPESAESGSLPEPDSKYLRAMNSAFNTSMLVDRMLMVTKDGTYQLYPGGDRKLSNAYYGIINGMQPLPAPPIAPDVQKRLEEARKVLWVPDDEGDLVLKSKLYRAYERNAQAYADAVADYADAEAEASINPAMARSWPIKSKSFRRAVDAAWDTLKSEGAEKIEAALDTIKSIGINVDARLIAKARQNFDSWNLGLAGGVPVDVPYAYCMPTSWPDFSARDVGWTEIEVTSREYSQHVGKDSHWFHSFSKNTSSSSTSASGGGRSLFGFGASGGYHKGDAHEDHASETGSTLKTLFHNDAKNIKIKFEFGTIDIFRPWLMGDLFYLKNWYLVGHKKNAISDGTLDGQVNNQNNLLPMIPMQFLVIRNVEITAQDWGRDSKTLKNLFGNAGGAWDKHNSSYHAGASYHFGPLLNLKGNVSHQQANEGVSRYGKSDSTEKQDYEAHFYKKTLTINGAQIVAFLSTIVPACPPMDDPGLANQ